MPKNAQTTAQLHSSHTQAKWCSKVSKPGLNSTWTMNFQMLKLDLEKVEDPEIKLPTSAGSSKKQEISRKKKNLFLLYWLCQSLWLCRSQQIEKFFKRWEYQTMLTCLLRNLYAGQEATVRNGHGTIDWFQIGKGVHQGCILSPYLFNWYAEYIIWDGRLDEAQAGIKMARKISIISDMQMTPSLWQIVKKN